MNNPGYIANMKLPDLGIGGSMALWGFRASAAGQSQCCAIVSGYERAFENQSDDVLALMLDYARMLGNDGNRRIGLGCSGCGSLTADELSIVAVLASAQLDADAATIAHLTWLMGGRPKADQMELVKNLALHFLHAGLVIQLPEISLSDWSARPVKNVAIYQSGTA
ncbi:MAG: hypothetical protein AAFY83_03965 [Pseudomonadota bacterium]